MTINHFGDIVRIDDLKSSKKGGDVMTDTIALKKIISDKGLKMKFVAEFLGLSYYGFLLKVENRQEFKTSEVSALCELLGINTLEEKEKIFFASKMI